MAKKTDPIVSELEYEIRFRVEAMVETKILDEEISETDSDQEVANGLIPGSEMRMTALQDIVETDRPGDSPSAARVWKKIQRLAAMRLDAIKAAAEREADRREDEKNEQPLGVEVFVDFGDGKTYKWVAHAMVGPDVRPRVTVTTTDGRIASVHTSGNG
jgi:hypothetical protein